MIRNWLRTTCTCDFKYFRGSRCFVNSCMPSHGSRVEHMVHIVSLICEDGATECYKKINSLVQLTHWLARTWGCITSCHRTDSPSSCYQPRSVLSILSDTLPVVVLWWLKTRLPCSLLGAPAQVSSCTQQMRPGNSQSPNVILPKGDGSHSLCSGDLCCQPALWETYARILLRPDILHIKHHLKSRLFIVAVLSLSLIGKLWS